MRGVAIFAKAFLGIPAQQAAKITRPLMPSAAPAVLRSLVRIPNKGYAHRSRNDSTRFRKACIFTTQKRFVKTHALSLLGTTRLRATSEACHFLAR